MGKNLELVKGERIIQEWKKTSEWPDGYPVSRLELILTAKNGGTQLEMLHSNVPAEQVSEYSGGWKSAYWEPLKEFREKGGVKGETTTMNKRKEDEKKKKKTTTATSRSSHLRSGSTMKKGRGKKKNPAR
jgi:Activator of Hsp90 ATPase homolog 1-like protein